MEEKTEFRISSRGGERSTQDEYAEIKRGNPERGTIQSQKSKHVNGKLSSGGIEVGYSASIDNPDYLLEEDKSNNEIINASTSGLCILTQNESGNKINLHLTTPEEKEHWEICFTSLIPFNAGVDMESLFMMGTSISGEYGPMDDGGLYKDWVVNQRRNTINVYISNMYPGNNVDILSWLCFDKNGNAFNPSHNAFNPDYNLDSSYFTTKTTGLGSYTLTKISTPSVSDCTLVLYSRFNPTKKYPLDLNFYWGFPTT